MTTYTHKVIAYFPLKKNAIITYYASKGEAMVGANEAKIAGATEVVIQMV